MWTQPPNLISTNTSDSGSTVRNLCIYKKESIIIVQCRELSCIYCTLNPAPSNHKLAYFLTIINCSLQSYPFFASIPESSETIINVVSILYPTIHKKALCISFYIYQVRVVGNFHGRKLSRIDRK